MILSNLDKQIFKFNLIKSNTVGRTVSAVALQWPHASSGCIGSGIMHHLAVSAVEPCIIWLYRQWPHASSGYTVGRAVSVVAHASSGYTVGHVVSAVAHASSGYTVWARCIGSGPMHASSGYTVWARCIGSCPMHASSGYTVGRAVSAVAPCIIWLQGRARSTGSGPMHHLAARSGVLYRQWPMHHLASRSGVLYRQWPMHHRLPQRIQRLQM